MSVVGDASPAMPFGDRLAAAVVERGSQIVLGIDPDPARLWPNAVGEQAEWRARLAGALADAEHAAMSDPGDDEPAAPHMPAVGSGATPARAERVARSGPVQERVARLQAAAAVLVHCRALIDAAGPACVAVKPQLACFERLGFAGWLALEATVAHARAHGLIVIADAKRGDIASTATAYAQALFDGTPTPFGPSAGLGADAATANPLLGGDALAPLVDAARRGGGLFVLVRTSNPSATDFFDAELADGGPLWERIAAQVAELGTPGPVSGLAEIGAVTGATVPRHLARMRELMPHTPFLLPGIGAQGGDVAALAPAFTPGRAAGLVSASRSIANAHQTTGGDPAAAARAEAERLRDQAWSLV